MNILIAENESALVGVLQRGFEAENYAVDVAGSAHQAIPMLQDREYHTAIIDLDLPPTEGIAILEFVREKYRYLPTLVLTSCVPVADCVQVLDTGADDLLQKPFAFPELAARVRAIMRRGSHLPEVVLRVEDLELNADASGILFTRIFDAARRTTRVASGDHRARLEPFRRHGNQRRRCLHQLFAQENRHQGR